jgi:hypothetical protein
MNRAVAIATIIGGIAAAIGIYTYFKDSWGGPSLTELRQMQLTPFGGEEVVSKSCEKQSAKSGYCCTVMMKASPRSPVEPMPFHFVKTPDGWTLDSLFGC